MAVPQDGEAGVDLFLLQREVLQGPLDAHEEEILERVDVLLEVEDIAPVGEDEAGDVMHESGLVRAVDEEGGGVCGGHGEMTSEG